LFPPPGPCFPSGDSDFLFLSAFHLNPSNLSWSVFPLPPPNMSFPLRRSACLDNCAISGTRPFNFLSGISLCHGDPRRRAIPPPFPPPQGLSATFSSIPLLFSEASLYIRLASHFSPIARFCSLGSARPVCLFTYTALFILMVRRYILASDPSLGRADTAISVHMEPLLVVPLSTTGHQGPFCAFVSGECVP